MEKLEEAIGFDEKLEKEEGGGGDKKNSPKRRVVTNLGNGSELIYIPQFLCWDESWKMLEYLDTHIPWTRPSIHVYGRSCVQPRDTCYVADPGLPELRYSGYQPPVHSWDDYPPLQQILANGEKKKKGRSLELVSTTTSGTKIARTLSNEIALAISCCKKVHEALPGSSFNSLLLNRYKSGSDYVAWHADDEKLYGPTPEIASVSFGCEREFLLRKRTTKSPKVQEQTARTAEESPNKRLKKSNHSEQHSFLLKHGSLLVMKGNTQRDWVHSVPKRARADAVRINLTFRHVFQA